MLTGSVVRLTAEQSGVCCLCVPSAHSGGYDHLRSAESFQLSRRPLVQSPAPAAAGQRHRGTAGNDPPVSPV